jgi:hypothetical protein
VQILQLLHLHGDQLVRRLLGGELAGSAVALLDVSLNAIVRLGDGVGDLLVQLDRLLVSRAAVEPPLALGGREARGRVAAVPGVGEARAEVAEAAGEVVERAVDLLHPAERLVDAAEVPVGEHLLHELHLLLQADQLLGVLLEDEQVLGEVARVEHDVADAEQRVSGLSRYERRRDCGRCG